MNSCTSASTSARHGARAWVIVAARISLSAFGVWLWWWGVSHWPRLPEPYGPGFWAWASAFVVLVLSWTHAGRWKRPRMTPGGWSALAILLSATALRFYQIIDVPFAVHADESVGLPALEAMRVGTAENIFSRIDRFSTGSPGLLIGLQWLLGFVSDNWFSAGRLAAATWGVLSIIATFGAARRLHSTAVALASSAMLTLSYWHLVGSRMQTMNCAFAAAAMWWAIARACDSRRAVDAIFAGIVIGLGLQLYDPVKVMFVIIPAWWIWHAIVTPGFARAMSLSLLGAGVVGWMVLYPMLEREGWQSYLRRTYVVTALGEIMAPETRKEMPLLREHGTEQLPRLSRFVTGGAAVAANHPSDAPLLNYVELGMAGLGLLMSLRNFRSRRWTVAPLWLALTAAVLVLSSVPDASYRFAVALPAFAILAGIGVTTILDWSRQHLPARMGLAVAMLLTAVLLAADIEINLSRATTYFKSMQRAHERDTLGRFIAENSSEVAYYVEAAPLQAAHRNFRALTLHRTVMNVPNLVDQVPETVDSQRPAVFVVPHWASAHSLWYLRRVYPSAEPRPVVDPSGFVAGYMVTVEPDPATPADSEEQASCGLRRVHCNGHPGTVDPYLAFLDLGTLCAKRASAEIKWRGTIEIPDPPPLELGLASDWTISTSLVLNGSPVQVDPVGRHGSLTISLPPGPHSITINAKVDVAGPTALSLWWRLPGEQRRTVPCNALMPAPTRIPLHSPRQPS